MSDATWEVLPQPKGARTGRRSAKYDEVRNALLTLRDDESIRVGLDFFSRGSAKAAPATFLLMNRYYGRRLRTRKLPDGYYLWLDPETKVT
jgi:hypothetical protein